jgi:universal stress protein B
MQRTHASGSVPDFTLNCLAGYRRAIVPERISVSESPGGCMISTVALFWALCVVCIVNMVRYFSSLRALLVVLRGCDPLLYQYVDGGGFFTAHGQPNKQVRLVRYIYARRYLDHHDEEFIRRCERVRRQFILTSALCGLVAISLLALIVWQ